MREITAIEMATDEEIYDVKLGDEFSICESGDGFDLVQGDEPLNWYPSLKQLQEAAVKYACSDDLIVSGYGKYSGRKFWQLPRRIQIAALKLAGLNIQLYHRALPLQDYINRYFNGNQTAFATAQGVKPPQITQWKDKSFIVVNHHLYSPRRKLKLEFPATPV